MGSSRFGFLTASQGAVLTQERWSRKTLVPELYPRLDSSIGDRSRRCWRVSSLFCRVFRSVMSLGKLAIVIGAGLVGSALSKEGRLSDITDIFSGALKIVTKHLQQDKDSSRSSGKPQTDSLLAQVNNLRQELQVLASSRSVTIVTGTSAGSGTYGVTAVIVIGVVGYGYVWWKGWKLSDMMFVTRRGLSDACTAVGKKLELVSSSIADARRHLSSRIDRVDINLDECRDLTNATKGEVSRLNGELSGIHQDVESVHRFIQTLGTKISRIEESQDITTRGLYSLCMFVDSMENRRDAEPTQVLPSSSRLAIEPPQTTPVTRVRIKPFFYLSLVSDIVYIHHSPKLVGRFSFHATEYLAPTYDTRFPFSIGITISISITISCYRDSQDSAIINGCFSFRPKGVAGVLKYG
uniref:Uncharacterized protein LOC105042139 isoform X2 n=1 Tax=Elaeis guineensis var. tenera TaxID=51953 RepID=A0A8N4EXM4_ELAGV|nr:uncharacterized protein LOC105042139 isoform X2 [Elaeis guineensis]